jgi:aryl-alcohol dehydrogenase-like predicted oxidoreductase
VTYLAASDRYEGKMQYRRCGRSGLDLPVLSLGYWHNFGEGRPFEVQRAIARRAFDLGDEVIVSSKGRPGHVGRPLWPVQRLAQVPAAPAWALRDQRVTSLVIGASSIEQLDQNVGALDNSSSPTRN